MTEFANSRRRIALRAYGALRLADRAEAGLQDIEGAIAQGQFGMAAFQARRVVLVCLSVRSLAQSGEIEFDDDSASFDWFAGLVEDEITAGLALANAGVDLNETNAGDWLDRFRAYLAETEGLLGYDAPLPALRSPAGAFGLFGMMRRWSTLLDELGLPPLLPGDWAPSSRPKAAPR